MQRDPQFPDRRADLFGREAVLQELLDRSEAPGVTALVGRPLSGKTWLLQELGRRLDHDRATLVGYYESGGDAPDILLRCISDLYTRWLQTASVGEQFKTLLDRRKGDFSGLAGEAVARIIKTVSSLRLPVWSTVATAVDEGLNTLLAVDSDRRTGGLTLSKLNYDQAQELLEVLVRITDRPAMLVLDSWEKAPQLEMQKDLLDKYLHHPEDWPRTHLFLGIRREKAADPALAALSDLELNPGLSTRELGPIELDETEEARLLERIQQEIPAAKELTTRRVLDLIGGQAGVLYRWRVGHPTDTGQLEALARDAQFYSYPELRDALANLRPAQARVAAKIALLPQVADPRDWRTLDPLIFTGDDHSAIEDLIFEGVLAEDSEPPSYGHSTRHEAAQVWFTKDAQGTRYGRREVAFMIETLHESILETSAETERYRLAELLSRTFQNAADLHLAQDIVSLGHAAVAITEARPGWFGRILDWFGDLFTIKSARGAAERVLNALLLITESEILERDAEGRVFLAEFLRLLTRVAEHWDADDKEMIVATTAEYAAEELTDITGDWKAFLAASSETDPRTWAAGQVDPLHTLRERYPEDAGIQLFQAYLGALTLPRPGEEPGRAARDEALRALFERSQSASDDDLGEAFQAACDIALEDELEGAARAGAEPNRALQAARTVFEQYPEQSLEPYARLLLSVYKSPDRKAWREAVLSELRQLATDHPESPAVASWAEAELFCER